VVHAPCDGTTQLVITNMSGITQRVPEGAVVGEAQIAEVVTPVPNSTNAQSASIRKLSPSQDGERRRRLLESLQLYEVPPSDAGPLCTFLADNHDVFSLEEGERGETSLLAMEIDTGDAPPRKQPPRRMPFLVREEVARQLKNMQQNGVIQPSNSPWSSPVVMVRKKDGSHRFCVDYRTLNSVTKADTFPLPRIDDFLDQLGGARYFSTLDLASGFWQIQMEPVSREKTAFVTPHGLYEFLVMPFGLKNAPAVFQRLMQRVLHGLNPEDGKQFIAVYLDDILVFSETLQDHLAHLRSVIDRLKSANLKLKPAKCMFVRKEVEYLGHVITAEGLKPNPRITEAVRSFPVPESVQGVRRFLGMASYYRRFIPRFAKIARPLHHLTAKDVPFQWSPECETAFATLKEKLVTPPVLTYPRFGEKFTLETDASVLGLGAVLSQKQADQRLQPIAYASRALNPAEKNYSVTELETLGVVWGISHFHSYMYLYGGELTVITDHSAVKSVLEAPNPTGKHARWWTRVYGRGIKSVDIVYRAGRENASADALSRSPVNPPPSHGIGQDEMQVSAVATSGSDTPEHLDTGQPLSSLLRLPPASSEGTVDYSSEQMKDPTLKGLVLYLQDEQLPDDPEEAKKVAAKASQFALADGVLTYLDRNPGDRKRVAVPLHLREEVIRVAHGGVYAGHFAGPKLYNTLSRRWWWPGMYNDVLSYCKRCPECAVVSGTDRQHRPPLKPIPIQRPFQKVGVDIMDLPCTERGNKHVVVFQDMFTKWPLVFPVPDQRADRLVRLLCEEVIPMFGVPEALLSDRGANLLSHLMRDVCRMLGMEKLNTTAYHPECDGMVERFNRTLKSMLRKRAAQFGNQWDQHLPALLWAYRNAPHDTTGEKPSFLLFGWDCRSPPEAALLPVSGVEPSDIRDYREELVLSLSSARETALKAIRKAQERYKKSYDRRSDDYSYRVGDWVLIRFPSEEAGRLRKLSRPWHGPYRVTACNETNVTAVKVYYPREDAIQVHQLRVKPCPPGFPAGFYWYGAKRKGPGRPPRWVEDVLAGCEMSTPRSRQTNDSAADPGPGLPASSDGTGASSAPDASAGHDAAEGLPGIQPPGEPPADNEALESESHVIVDCEEPHDGATARERNEEDAMAYQDITGAHSAQSDTASQGDQPSSRAQATG